MEIADNSLGTWTILNQLMFQLVKVLQHLKMDCTTADASPAASDNLILQQRFEGQNLQYLKKGTANAVSLTALSFWVKSTKLELYIVNVFDDIDNNRQISKSYTVM
jgi:hypothetical protein